MTLSRRSLIRGTAATLVAGATLKVAAPVNRALAAEPTAFPSGLSLGPELPFSFEALTARAKALAAEPFTPTPAVAPKSSTSSTTMPTRRSAGSRK